MSIYKSPEGKARLLAFYDRGVAQLGVPFEDRYVDTRFGQTHVLVMGPEHAPPVVLLHGGNVLNPVSTAWFTPLARDFRLYAPDTMGHPGKSAETRISPNDNSYAQWVVDVLDGLHLDKPAFIGPSYGGGILIRTAAYAPHRIGQAALVVPAGIAGGSKWRFLTEIIIPMLTYMAFRHRPSLVKSIQAQMTEPVPEELLEICAAIFEDVKIEASFPKNATAQELAAYTAPTLLITAEHCIFFPPETVVPRARAIFRNLVASEVIPHSQHSPDAAGRALIVERIRTFFTEGR